MFSWLRAKRCHVPESQRGIAKPLHCARGKTCCEPLAQISANDGSSFVCMGCNDGTERPIDQDRLSFCFVNDWSDDEWFIDEHDAHSMSAVLAHGLAVDNCIRDASNQ